MNDTKWRTVAIIPAAPGRYVDVADAGRTGRYPIVGYAVQRTGCLHERITSLVLCPEGNLVPVDDFESAHVFIQPPVVG
ncbi:hypothetical protein [Prescottella equi]|uniref:hypothetical protein n=1 Tax=Rhodococcus hoagii TaxID=43767 RepID=UPI000A11E7CF|nr:hypothetical protein [Prescottella equi]ORM00694.1 hypothetical protein A5N69_07060 [Prescottella equi]ORM21565.1 hypothetical protein A5N74_01635 [Prescottella equi]